MAMEYNNYRTPGQLIKALLDKRGWTQEVLAVILGMYSTSLSDYMTGKRPVNAEMAKALEKVFAVEAKEFINLQATYDLAKAEIEWLPDPGLTKRTQLFGNLPIKAMIKRGWLNIDNINDVPRAEEALARFFGVETVDEIEILPHAAKKTDTFAEASPAQLAWIYRVKQIADNMLVATYSQGSVREAISLLEPLRSAPEETRKVPRILAEHGIRYVIVETLPSAKIDGVCFWLDDGSPVVGMSLRYDRIDNFWFVLRHELEHVLRLHGRDSTMVMLDAELEGERAGVGASISEEERLANDAAGEFCIPTEMMDKFIACQSPRFDLRDFLGFANLLHVHPGLVAGQLQRRSGRYDLFRKYLVNIRDIVVPNAKADGWGYVASDGPIGG
jgi:HTH-type transcriptional regulator/antitoxin HigA